MRRVRLVGALAIVVDGRVEDGVAERLAVAVEAGQLPADAIAVAAVLGRAQHAFDRVVDEQVVEACGCWRLSCVDDRVLLLPSSARRTARRIRVADSSAAPARARRDSGCAGRRRRACVASGLSCTSGTASAPSRRTVHARRLHARQRHAVANAFGRELVRRRAGRRIGERVAAAERAAGEDAGGRRRRAAPASTGPPKIEVTARWRRRPRRPRRCRRRRRPGSSVPSGQCDHGGQVGGAGPAVGVGVGAGKRRQQALDVVGDPASCAPGMPSSFGTRRAVSASTTRSPRRSRKPGGAGASERARQRAPSARTSSADDAAAAPCRNCRRREMRVASNCVDRRPCCCRMLPAAIVVWQTAAQALVDARAPHPIHKQPFQSPTGGACATTAGDDPMTDEEFEAKVKALTFWSGKNSMTLEDMATIQPGLARLMPEVGARTWKLFYAAKAAELADGEVPVQGDPRPDGARRVHAAEARGGAQPVPRGELEAARGGDREEGLRRLRDARSTRPSTWPTRTTS